MIYIKLFQELQRNILPKYGKILRLVNQPGQAGTKKDLACPGNSKSQIPNYKHRVSFGQILNAFGEEYVAVFLIFKKLGENFLPVNGLY